MYVSKLVGGIDRENFNSEVREVCQGGEKWYGQMEYKTQNDPWLRAKEHKEQAKKQACFWGVVGDSCSGVYLEREFGKRGHGKWGSENYGL